MTPDNLTPDCNLLTQGYVLAQAWKKTANYMRYHNWYSDTLEIDRTAVNLPRFLDEVAERLAVTNEWESDPLRIVPAPKSQQWRINADTNRWEPVEGGKTGSKLRPIAHVTLRDQVAATAVMLCLADRIETLQGDPSISIDTIANRSSVLSYGNRLFCDGTGSHRHHRWGSSKLYRAYYEDYRNFIQRPETVAETIKINDRSQIVILYSDLRQFYDRVRPQLLAAKLDSITKPDDDPVFFDLAKRIFSWEWSTKDSREVAEYSRQAGLEDFSKVALPQGLVASGFFANLVLGDFDRALKASFSQEIEPGLHLIDVCRYVDDLRIVFKADRDKTLLQIEQIAKRWLDNLLNMHAEGLQVREDKTKALLLRGDERLMVRQSRKMARIQSAVSGGFDAIAGQEILDAVQGLMRSQERYSEKRVKGDGWSQSPVPDVRDETVARFAAGRYRSTYRSLRPLLAEPEVVEYGISIIEPDSHPSNIHTQADLDNEARAFALGLIENWVNDPSNVRLLRIGLDLWPDAAVVKKILDLLKPFAGGKGKRKAPRRVAWYCLGEIFRSAATETGIVEDTEALPIGVDIDAYRKVLQGEAIRLLTLPASTLPWYLKQQVLLFLATINPASAPFIRTGKVPEMKHYREQIRFLRGEDASWTGGNFATLAILSRRSFLDRNKAISLILPALSPNRIEEISARDPSFAIELLEARKEYVDELSPRIREDFCLGMSNSKEGWMSLADAVLQGGPAGLLRNEITILSFALKFLELLPTFGKPGVITPFFVQMKISSNEGTSRKVEELDILPSRSSPTGSLYECPRWCSQEDRWRFQVGYLLRFILTARQDFTKVVRTSVWKGNAATYRIPDSHWYQRIYGFFNGHAAFGDDWLPISDWTENLLSALLQWPGCRSPENMEWIKQGVKETIRQIRSRIEEISEMQVTMGGLLLLPLNAPRIRRSAPSQPLRACVIQTVIPSENDIRTDLTCSTPSMRRRHRNHLSAAIAAIERMLDLRETHVGREGRLDFLIFPELAVHPRDVKTHLIRFARKHKTIILAGLTYQELVPGQPLVNSALWVIPEWSPAHGLQMITRLQGKYHLAPDEQDLNNPKPVIMSFRPCQWLVEYQWSQEKSDPPLRLTASVCYDATDLSLTSALRHYSDVFAIPALNKDVNTFDHMALALHYHMFQMVIVANNGLYGGSNAYAPYSDPFKRQVFHLHGQPQASIAFFEIDDIADFLGRKIMPQAHAASNTPPSSVAKKWKSPPAGIA